MLLAPLVLACDAVGLQVVGDVQRDAARDDGAVRPLGRSDAVLGDLAPEALRLRGVRKEPGDADGHDEDGERDEVVHDLGLCGWCHEFSLDGPGYTYDGTRKTTTIRPLYCKTSWTIADSKWAQHYIFILI